MLIAADRLPARLPLGTGQIVSMSIALIAGSIPFCAHGTHDGSAGERLGRARIRKPRLSTRLLSLRSVLSVERVDVLAGGLWPQYHINQLAMQAAGITKPYFIPVQMAIAWLVGFTVLFSAVAIWRLARKG
jgi:ABC-2 type transport system permease protein